MSDPDWELSVYCRIRWYKVLPSYGPHPSTWTIGMIGAHQPGGPRAPKLVKTALLEASRHRASRSGLFFGQICILAIFQFPVKILKSPLDSATSISYMTAIIWRSDDDLKCF